MTSTSTSASTSTSDGSFLRYESPKTKIAFKSDKRYHVFLSFRGTDVRKTFVDHLYEALSVAGLNVYKDDENLGKGEEIWPSLKEAIDSSAIRIPIFSDGYAHSDWCLREAAAMLETSALIIPLFYHVNPTHVRYPEKEPSPYSKSFQKHRSHSDRYKKEEIDGWTDALRQICKRSGWSTDITDGYEARMVKTVVNDLIKRLDMVPLQVAKHPVGLDSVKNALIQKLNVNSVDDVVKIGIWGIGGIGKTTVAKALYNKFYDDFEAASFVSNVRTTAEAAGLTKLQKKVLKDLAKHNTEVDSVEEGICLLRNHLGGKCVLLILDDVDAVVQLDAVVGDWLARGSRVIITSRNKHILNAWVSSECIHEMNGLEIKESLELFSWHAFLRASPSLGYEELSRRIAEACKGHPLSLEVIGSFLYDKKGDSDTGCWKEALYDIIHYSDIYKILYISYNTLSDEEKEIFVDIACFFIGERKTLPIILWESLYKKVHTAISNLCMKLLIKIDDEGLFDMHDHLRDMGRIIAEKEKKGNRKWEHSPLSTVSNDLSRLRLIGGNPQSLEMLYIDDLRYLHLQNLTIECLTKDMLLMLPPSLIWLRFENCSFDIGMNRAVKNSCHSRIVDNIWQCKIMQVKRFQHLSSLPDTISNLSQLQKLDLYECESLSSLPATIGNLSQLQKLDLQGCKSLSSLPDTICNLSQLQKLDLTICESLSSLPDNIGDLSQLKELSLFGCESLSSLPDSIGNLTQLQKLDLGMCESLRGLPDGIGNLSKLQKLDLTICESLSNLPDSIGKLSQLQQLNLNECGSLRGLPDAIGNLSNLQKLDLTMCESLSSLPDSIGKLSQLEELNLNECESLSSLPDSIGYLSQLEELSLRMCKSLSSLPDSIGNLSQLELLNLFGCKSLSSLPDSIGNLSQLKLLNLCGSLTSLPDWIGNLSQLQQLDLTMCKSLSSLPDSIGNLSQLEKLQLHECESLSSLPDSIVNLSQLEKLILSMLKSLSSLPGSIGNLSKLEFLNLLGCGRLSSLPDSIGNLSQLEFFSLDGCESLTSLPDSIGNLSQLKELILFRCVNLSRLPDSIGNLSQLQKLDLEMCDSLRSLPNSIGNLSQIEELNLN